MDSPAPPNDQPTASQRPPGITRREWAIIEYLRDIDGRHAGHGDILIKVRGPVILINEAIQRKRIADC